MVQTEDGARLQMAIICSQILKTKWWQFWKRYKLDKQARRLALIWKLDY